MVTYNESEILRDYCYLREAGWHQAENDRWTHPRYRSDHSKSFALKRAKAFLERRMERDAKR